MYLDLRFQISPSFQYLGQNFWQGHFEEGNMENTESSIA